MLLDLFDWLTNYYGGFRVFGYLTLRAIFAALTALSIALLIGPWMIRLLARKQIGQVVRDDGPDTHLGKRGTPGRSRTKPGSRGRKELDVPSANCSDEVERDPDPESDRGPCQASAKRGQQLRREEREQPSRHQDGRDQLVGDLPGAEIRDATNHEEHREYGPP